LSVKNGFIFVFPQTGYFVLVKQGNTILMPRGRATSSLFIRG
jgi:hypothetical protein